MRQIDTDAPAHPNGAATVNCSVPDPRATSEPVDLELKEDQEVGLASTEQAGRLIDQYVQELRKEIAVGVQPLAQPTGARRLIWALGLGTVAAAMVIFVALWHQNQTLSAAGQTAARQAQAICMDRQARVMHAIADYTRDHHEAPPDLVTLWPNYLRAPAADPTTGEPFRYARDGTMVALSCPRHPLTPLQALPESPPAASSE